MTGDLSFYGIKQQAHYQTEYFGQGKASKPKYFRQVVNGSCLKKRTDSESRLLKNTEALEKTIPVPCQMSKKKKKIKAMTLITSSLLTRRRDTGAVINGSGHLPRS